MSEFAEHFSFAERDARMPEDYRELFEELYDTLVLDGIDPHNHFVAWEMASFLNRTYSEFGHGVVESDRATLFVFGQEMFGGAFRMLEKSEHSYFQFEGRVMGFWVYDRNRGHSEVVLKVASKPTQLEKFTARDGVIIVESTGLVPVGAEHSVTYESKFELP